MKPSDVRPLGIDDAGRATAALIPNDHGPQTLAMMDYVIADIREVTGCRPEEIRVRDDPWRFMREMLRGGSRFEAMHQGMGPRLFGLPVIQDLSIPMDMVYLGPALGGEA